MKLYLRPRCIKKKEQAIGKLLCVDTINIGLGKVLPKEVVPFLYSSGRLFPAQPIPLVWQGLVLYTGNLDIASPSVQYICSLLDHPLDGELMNPTDDMSKVAVKVPYFESGTDEVYIS